VTVNVEMLNQNVGRSVTRYSDHVGVLSIGESEARGRTHAFKCHITAVNQHSTERSASCFDIVVPLHQQDRTAYWGQRLNCRIDLLLIAVAIPDEVRVRLGRFGGVTGGYGQGGGGDAQRDTQDYSSREERDAYK